MWQDAIDQSHHGRPTVIHTVHTGQRGRPRIEIDPQFLDWAYTQRTTTGMSNFLGVSRRVVRYALLEHGIAEPQPNPFSTLSAPISLGANTEAHDVNDNLLEPIFPVADIQQVAPCLASFTGPLSPMSDEELDGLVIQLRSHFKRAGISMLDGMLRRLGHWVPRRQIRESLLRIDPVRRVFERITIRRCEYHVAGPNSLWHHDGQHGMYAVALLA